MITEDIFVNSSQNICSDPSSEPSRQDGSNEGSQHMVSMRNTEKDIIKYSLLSRALLHHIALATLATADQADIRITVPGLVYRSNVCMAH